MEGGYLSSGLFPTQTQVMLTLDCLRKTNGEIIAQLEKLKFQQIYIHGNPSAHGSQTKRVAKVGRASPEQPPTGLLESVAQNWTAQLNHLEKSRVIPQAKCLLHYWHQHPEDGAHVNALQTQLRANCIVISQQPQVHLNYDTSKNKPAVYEIHFRLLGGSNLWGNPVGSAKLRIFMEHLAQIWRYGRADMYQLDNPLQEPLKEAARLSCIDSFPAPFKFKDKRVDESTVIQHVVLSQPIREQVILSAGEPFHTLGGQFLVKITGRFDLQQRSLPFNLKVPFRMYYGLVSVGEDQVLSLPCTLVSNDSKMTAHHGGDWWMSDNLLFYGPHLPPPPVRRQDEPALQWREIVLRRRRQSPYRTIKQILAFIDQRFISYAGISDGLHPRSKKYLEGLLQDERVSVPDANSGNLLVNWAAYSEVPMNSWVTQDQQSSIGTWVQYILDDLRSDAASRKIWNLKYCRQLEDADELEEEFKSRGLKNTVAIKISDRLGPQATICFCRDDGTTKLYRCQKFSAVGTELTKHSEYRGVEGETKMRHILCLNGELRDLARFIKITTDEETEARRDLKRLTVKGHSKRKAAPYYGQETVEVPELPLSPHMIREQFMQAEKLFKGINSKFNQLSSESLEDLDEEGGRLLQKLTSFADKIDQCLTELIQQLKLDSSSEPETPDSFLSSPDFEESSNEFPATYWRTGLDSTPVLSPESMRPSDELYVPNNADLYDYGCVRDYCEQTNGYSEFPLGNFQESWF